ncbi:MAG TPA: hypothetical protein VNS32_01850 [Flavisolibacter sp.]|nr:hypothetical protein [Flavisolibacter sp.]
MTIQNFTTLSQHIQHQNLLLNGEYIADRSTEEAQILLFQLGHFFVEVYFSQDGDDISHTHSFEDAAGLVPYLLVND